MNKLYYYMQPIFNCLTYSSFVVHRYFIFYHYYFIIYRTGQISVKCKMFVPVCIQLFGNYLKN